MTGGAKGARDYPGRLLVPTPIPPMENRTERFAEVRRSDGVRIPEGFPGRAATVTVPAHTTAEILLDNDSLTTAYLSLLFSGGKGLADHRRLCRSALPRYADLFKDDRNEVKTNSSSATKISFVRTAATAGSIRHCGGVHGGMSN